MKIEYQTGYAGSDSQIPKNQRYNCWATYRGKNKNYKQNTVIGTGSSQDAARKDARRIIREG